MSWQCDDARLRKKQKRPDVGSSLRVQRRVGDSLLQNCTFCPLHETVPWVHFHGAVKHLLLGHASSGTIDRTVGQTPNRVPRLPCERASYADRFTGDHDLSGMPQGLGKLGDNVGGPRRYHGIYSEVQGVELVRALYCFPVFDPTFPTTLRAGSPRTEYVV